MSLLSFTLWLPGAVSSSICHIFVSFITITQHWFQLNYPFENFKSHEIKHFILLFCIYYWSNPNRLHISQWAAIPTHAGTFLHALSDNLLILLIFWLTFHLQAIFTLCRVLFHDVIAIDVKISISGFVILLSFVFRTVGNFEGKKGGKIMVYREKQIMTAWSSVRNQHLWRNKRNK